MRGRRYTLTAVPRHSTTFEQKHECQKLRTAVAVFAAGSVVAQQRVSSHRTPASNPASLVLKRAISRQKPPCKAITAQRHHEGHDTPYMLAVKSPTRK
jgi:hypothetical protein